MKTFSYFLLGLVLMLGGIGCASVSSQSSPESIVQDWHRTELYFSAVPLRRWEKFLDKEVTPRFPDGLSWFDLQGQWKMRKTGVIHKLPSRVLVILHQPDEDSSRRLDEIREAFKREFHDESVLRVTQPAKVSF